MPILQFDQLKCANQLMMVNTQDAYNKAVAKFFKSAECVAEYQAYVRATPNANTTITQALTQQFNGRPAGPGVLPATVKTYLYNQADNYFTTTVLVNGNNRLATEQQTRRTHWTTGAGKGEFPDLHEYWQQGLVDAGQGHLITPRQAAGYIDLLAATILPYQTKTDHIEYNQSHKQAVKALTAINTVRNLLQTALKADDGSLNQQASQWTNFKSCVNYWQAELPKQALRQPVIDELRDLVADGKPAKLFRLVSTAEKDFIVSKGKLAQGPGSYERHKWFFYTFGDTTGAPSVGHDWKVEVKISANVLALLLERAVECGDQKADSRQAIIKKANELNCVGIHEDVLRPFHTVLGGFVITNMQNSKLPAVNAKVQP